MKKSKHPRWNRREFIAGAATLAFGRCALAQLAESKSENAHGRDVYIVSNFHPASCGWLADFSEERVYCVNSYLSHLDRVRDDGEYQFALSEINNIIGIMNFRPERIPELKQRVTENALNWSTASSSNPPLIFQAARRSFALAPKACGGTKIFSV
ncbi:hypothetical protein [Acidicapsa acidisoli]|uniref:hypothetical protein n=1 Tax=Acidicapsa acidisoli TaxID=1615681 RepID=UPI0021E05A53|nr:hypothetical protein [Acidicapsa acidisoli]